MKVSLRKAAPSRQATKPEGEKQLSNKGSRKFDGVELSKPKNLNKPSDVSRREENQKAVATATRGSGEGKRVRFKAPEESESEAESPAPPKPEKPKQDDPTPRKRDEPVSRPFDGIAPIEVEPLLRNLPKGVIPTQPKGRGGAPFAVAQAKENTPAYKLRSEIHQPGLAETVADRIMSAPMSLTAAEVCEISP